jgi:hypothetical protein
MDMKVNKVLQPLQTSFSHSDKLLHLDFDLISQKFRINRILLNGPHTDGAVVPVECLLNVVTEICDG